MNKDLDANVAKNVDGAPLHIDNAGARAMGRIDGGEDLGEEPSLGGTPAQLDNENFVRFGAGSVPVPVAQSAMNLSTSMDFPIPLSPYTISQGIRVVRGCLSNLFKWSRIWTAFG